MLDWLMDNGGLVIRYRTARELIGMDIGSLELKSLGGALTGMTEVVRCMGNIKPPILDRLRNTCHGSSDCCFENSMAKAINLGLHKGMPQLDEAVGPWIDYVKESASSTPHPRECFGAIIVAGLLSKAGYDDDVVTSFLLASLKDLSEFTNRRDYDIYMSEISHLKGMPKNFKGKPVIRQELSKEKGFVYPLVHDVVGISGLYALRSPSINEMIASVISYILSPEFHRVVADGYGVLVSGPKKYHGMGWDPKVPGFFGIDDETKGNQLLYRTYLFASYPDAVKTDWFSKAIEHLEGFRTETGSYKFPNGYLPETTAYAVTGKHMGLGENRRNRNALEVESTFWMMKIKKLAATL